MLTLSPADLAANRLHPEHVLPVFYRRDQPLFVLRLGNVLDMLRQLPSNSVQICCSSPPYFAVRAYSGVEPTIWGGDPSCQHVWGDPVKAPGGFTDNYGEVQGVFNRAGQGYARHAERGQFCLKCKSAWLGCLGLEPDVDLYIAHLVEVYAEVHRVLRPDGVCWVNLGDSYAQGGSRATVKELASDEARVQEKDYPTGAFAGHRGWDRAAGSAGGDLKVKDLCLVPERFAIACQKAGWWVRSRCLWWKGNSLPQSAPDRPSPDHEHIWMLTKKPRYWYCREAVRKKAKGASKGSVSQQQHSGCPSEGTGSTRWFEATKRPVYEAYLRTVWPINTHPSPTPHSATFAPSLPRTCILLSTPPSSCGACGKPYDPVIEVDEVPDEEAVRRCGGDVNGEYQGEATKAYEDSLAQDPSATKARILRTLVRKRIVGWEVACKCEAEPVPPLVLDIFAGVGTTGHVANELGRRFIGFDLSEEYLEVARDPEGAKAVWHFVRQLVPAIYDGPCEAHGLKPRPTKPRRKPKPAPQPSVPEGQLDLFAAVTP